MTTPGIARKNMSALKRFILNDKAIFALVILNTVSIFVGGYYPNAFMFTVLDSIFTVLFMVEAVVKINDMSWKGYWKDGWNRFDFIITLAAIPSLVNLFVDGFFATNILLVLRVLRVFKALRLFRFIPHVSDLLKGITLAMKASFVVTIGVAVLLLVLSILTSTIFGQAAPEFFGTPGEALYSTFRMFTIEGWYEIPDAISSRSSTVMGVIARIYFAIELFLGGILGMSLINSIFVDAAVSDNNDDIKKELSEIKEMLEKISNNQ